ncbi:MAG: hypothetical protein V2J08_11255 [Desulfotignum sp.]|jgi:hypothetical protein|nr:hypothetical protein [Desulfotignum sp.]
MTENKGLKTGSILEQEGLIHCNDIDRVLAIQANGTEDKSGKNRRLFGSILCDLNLLTPVETYQALKKNNKLISLQDRLVSQNLLPASRVAQLSARSAETGMPFLGLLLEENQVPKPVIQQMLLDLFRIPLRSISDIVFSEKKRKTLSSIIPAAEAGRHQIIPLVLKEETLLCAITDPDALCFIAELDKKFPQYRLTPVFVSFSGFSWFFKILYQKSFDPQKTEENGQDQPAAEHAQENSAQKNRNLSPAPDISVKISDPVREKDKILQLYETYEQTRQQMGCIAQPGRKPAFLQFIQKQHQAVIENYRCRAVAFSFEKQGNRIMILAIPVKQET